MPTLLQWSETTGCGATIKLDNGDVVHVEIKGSRVTVRLWNLNNMITTLVSNLFGPKLYDEKSAAWNARAAAALNVTYPDREPALRQFANPLLSIFANAVWHCGSADAVRGVLGDAAAREAE